MIDELRAQAIRDYIRPYVSVDSHALQGAEYPVNSLYLDSPAFDLYWSSALGEKNRFKLRIRSYSDAAYDPVFLEVKRRVDRVIVKRRTKVSREFAQAWTRGECVWPDADGGNGSWDREAFAQFRDLSERILALPMVYVRYLREAYVSRFEEPVRITFDRRLAYRPFGENGHSASGADWRYMSGPDAVLEIKFTARFPEWVQRLVDRFGLVRDSFAKYVVCLDAMKQEGALVMPPARMYKS